jgi:hypothetical protein
MKGVYTVDLHSEKWDAMHTREQMKDGVGCKLSPMSTWNDHSAQTLPRQTVHNQGIVARDSGQQIHVFTPTEQDQISGRLAILYDTKTLRCLGNGGHGRER